MGVILTGFHTLKHRICSLDEGRGRKKKNEKKNLSQSEMASFQTNVH